MYNKQVLSEIIGSEAVSLIDSLLESRLIIKTGIKDDEQVFINAQIMISVCDDKAKKIGYTIVNFLEYQKPNNTEDEYEQTNQDDQERRENQGLDNTLSNWSDIILNRKD